MNKNTRYDIRLSVQLKNEFMSIGGNAEIVRTFMEDYIVRTNNDIMANENSNAIWNLSVPDKTESVHYDELVDPKTRQILKPFKVIEIRSGRLVRTYNPEPKQFVKKAFLNDKLFKLEVI